MREMSHPLDVLVEEFDDTELPVSGYTTLTLWVPTEVKERYSRVQAKSRRCKEKFSTRLGKIVAAVIDRVDGKAS